jgi:futalosine hydrolase
MKLLFVFATHSEAEPLLKHLGFNSGSRSNYISADLSNHRVDVLITGAGMVALTFALTKHLSNQIYHASINAGICGSFNKSLKPGTIVNVSEDRFADMGAQDGNRFIDMFGLGLIKKTDFPFEGGKLVAKHPLKMKSISSLKKAKGITVNTVHGNESSIQAVKKLYKPDVETMEGAAFFYTCHLHRMNCLQVKAVSNAVEKRNTKKWNIELAVNNLTEWVKKFLEELEQN